MTDKRGRPSPDARKAKPGPGMPKAPGLKRFARPARQAVVTFVGRRCPLAFGRYSIRHQRYRNAPDHFAANGPVHPLGADGWQVRFLGSNMPHSGILRAIGEYQPAVLGISATMIFNVPRVRRLIDEVRRQSGAKAPKIILGGSAFAAAPNLLDELGAAGFAPDLRSARTLVNQFSNSL